MKINRISEITAVFLFIAFLLLLIFSHRQPLFTDTTMNAFNTGWTYSYQDQEGDTVLPASLDVPKDTEVVFANTIPEEVGDNYALVFRTRMQNVKVYIEDRLIYQYPDQDLIGREIPSAWNFVRLSESDAGQRIRICISSPYTRFSGGISGVQYGEYNNLVTGIISAQIKILRMSILIAFLGMAVVLLSIVSRRYNIFTWHRNLGMLLIVIAVWLCGEAGMPSGKVGLEAWHYFALISLLFCPVFLNAYLYARWKDDHGKITGILFYVSLIAAVGCLASEVLGGPDLIQMIPLMHVMIGISLIYALLLYTLAARKKQGDFIRPHFIYNTLNSIRTLIRLDPKAAQQAVYDFSIYLRSNLENMGERDLIPFADELCHIRAYLDIEKIRFEERLNVVMDIQASMFLVPPLSIQPLVENAVKHGICTRMSG